MRVGTIESVEDKPEGSAAKGRTRGMRSSGSKSGGPGDGGNSGNDKDGGGGPGKRPYEPQAIDAPEKSRILMWFLLMVVVMTFSGLIGAYVVISTNHALEWRPFALPAQVWISTVIILASSLTFDLGKRALIRQNYLRYRNWFLLTTVLGAMFISSQILAWLALVSRGLYLTGNPYAGFFYILTAVHAVHVIGGICALGYTILRTWHPSDSRDESRKRVTDATVTGWYWHTMGILWLILLFLLAFWK